MSDEPPKFSLNKELKKRKTQEWKRTEEIKRKTQGTPAAPPPAAAPVRTTQEMAASKRATQVAARVTPARVEPSALNNRQRLIALGSALLILIVCTGSWLVASNQPPAPTPTWPPVPTSTVNDAINYLKQVGFPIGKTETLAVPNTTWVAREGVQFTAQQGEEKGRFLVLGYDSASQASLDAFRASGGSLYQNWKFTQIANLLILSSSDSGPALRNDLARHLTQHFIGPYRPFMQTSTPKG